MLNIPKEPVNVQNFLAGQWVTGSGVELNIVSPYTNGVIGKMKSSTASDVDAIVKKAKEASVAWGKQPIKERSQIMFRFRENLLKDMDEIAHCASSECGKTVGESRAGIMKGIEVLEYALSLQNADHGGRMEVSRGVFCEYRREPLGVVAGITPFNFPAMVPMWMIPIAITLGNSFVWKPSEKTPLTSLHIARAIQEAGLPDGVLSIAQGGRETVEALLDHKDIQSVGFVGSTAVAKSVFRRGSQNLTRVLALGGAKNHIILLPDAEPELTGSNIAASFTGCAGQRCMAASVLLAVGETDSLIERIVASAKALVPGDGTTTDAGPGVNANTVVGGPGPNKDSKAKAHHKSANLQMGAIISKESLAKLESAIAQAEKEGAKLLLDGRQPSVAAPYEGGNWIGPTIIDNVKQGSQAATEELFGPVLSIIRCNTLSEALKIENSNEYGNAASVFTQNGAAAEQVARQARAGMVGVNIGVPVPREPFSFGGFYESKFGVGDITGANSLNLWSNPKKLTTKWAEQKDSNWMS